MSLNINTNLLNTLQNFYDSQKGTGNRFTGSDESLGAIISAYGLSGVTDVYLDDGNLSKSIIESGVKVTVSSLNSATFSYKIDEETNKIIIFGNNLTITVDEENSDMIEVVGISNEINATSKDDNISVIGFDNKLNTGDGNDSVVVFGEDNILKDTENNIFAGVGGQYLIVDDKEFLAYLNDKDISENTSLVVEKTTDGLRFSGDNMKIVAQSDTDDNIELVGNNNYLDTSAGADNIYVTGKDNVIVTGVDGQIDTVKVNGSGNEIVSTDEDKIIYEENSGYVTITTDDKSQHYVTIKDSLGNSHEYLIERNSDNFSTIEISYEINEKDEVIFTGNNAKIIVQSDDDENRSDKIILIGDNNYIDTNVGDDEVTVSGSGNMVITGEGTDNIYIGGENNQVIGDKDDKVYYNSTSGSVILAPEDESMHFINVKDYSYLVQRNTDKQENVTFSYNITGSGVFEFEGDYFKITQQNDGVEDKVKITGNYNYVDTGDSNDRIDVIGNNNIVHAGEGDDNIAISGNNNEAYGDKGLDGIAVDGENNIKDGFEYEDKIITLNDSNKNIKIDLDGKNYTFDRTKTAEEAEKEVRIIVRNRGGVVTIEADDVVVTAGDSQEDIINFIGNNSKIFTRDKNDTINVLGDNNYVDGWTGDDNITVTGRKNRVYGFLGDDNIVVNERESTDDEIIEEFVNVADKDSDGNTLTDSEKLEIAKEKAISNGANYVNGEFDTDKINSSYYTDIDSVEIYTSLANQIKMDLNESERQILVDGKKYTITNYITYDSNNPFKIPRTISYEIQEYTDKNGEVKKQLVIKGDYIKVEAEDGQEDAVTVIGEKNYIDLKDEMDYLEVKGKYNMIFTGLGDDTLKVSGDENTISGGKGYDKMYISGSNSVWNDIEEVYGEYDTKDTLTNKEREKTIIIGDGLEYTIKANVDDDEELEKNISFTYSYKDGVLSISGDKIHVIAKDGQTDNVKLSGNDCVIELGDGNDIIEAKGARNDIYGGKGDDIIKIYGDSFKVFGNDGDDEIEAAAYNSKIYANDEKSSKSGNDKLTLFGGKNNTYSGFAKANVAKDGSKGIIVINPENETGKIKYTNIDGKEVVINVESIIQSPEELADEIFVEYEVQDILDENGNITDKKLIIKGSSISVNLTNKSDKSINAKIEGSNIRFQTFSGSDKGEVEGNNNEIYVGEGIDGKADGENTVIVNGNSNKVYGGQNIDTFNVNGNYNKIYGGGSEDILNLVGENNTYQVSPKDFKEAGSLVITNSNQPQYLVINGDSQKEDRIYKISLYNIEKANLETAKVELKYYIDSEGYINFEADYLKIEVIDNLTTQVTDEITTDNRDNIRLIGNNCYLSGGNGSDIILVKGNNNIIDGWYGDDSIIVEEGNYNEIRGFDGNDKITITKGNKNIVNGEN
ncbi:hypothetical protein IJS77_03430, partial [bacterium]|nr:hypothetical protein [bacterium]